MINDDLFYIYDIETYPTIFTIDFKHVASGNHFFFEISYQRDDRQQLKAFLQYLQLIDAFMVGFNNLGFDYPVMHELIKHIDFINNEQIYNKAMSIINSGWDNRFTHLVYPSEWYIKQIDLFKIHHFDNQSRRTSLKEIEFNLRMSDIQDLPYTPGSLLLPEHIPVLKTYNKHDVNATHLFFEESRKQIEFRLNLGDKFHNFADTKIGKDIFITALEESSPGICYEGKQPRQTYRSSIRLADIIFDYVSFEQPEFNRVLNWFKAQNITETKGVFNDVSAEINGFKFDFGTGGIHGSRTNAIYESDEKMVVLDLDVASYYPSLAIANKIYPQHLSTVFCDVYEKLFNTRRQYAKGTPENAAYKLALNGVYGDSNNKYSPFYDPQYTMTITINGQLLLCMLAEQLMKVPTLEMIQINTDGLTVYFDRQYRPVIDRLCQWWQNLTNLILEDVEYSRMFIRDVNNYIAEYTDGKVKRKGAYEYDNEWHQNQSKLIVAKAAESALIDGTDPEWFIKNHRDPFDFCLRIKAPGGSTLKLSNGEKLQRVTRYYITNEGDALFKISPPPNGVRIGTWKRASKLTDQYYNIVINEIRGTDDPSTHDVNGCPWDERINTKNKSKYEERQTGVNTGYLVKVCNNMNNFDWSIINYDFYINECKKLLSMLKGV